MAYASDAYIVRAAKQVDGINLEWENEKYDPAKGILGLDDSDMLDCLDLEEKVTPVENLAKVRPTTIPQQTKAKNTNILNKLYVQYIWSK